MVPGAAVWTLLELRRILFLAYQCSTCGRDKIEFQGTAENEVLKNLIEIRLVPVT